VGADGFRPGTMGELIEVLFRGLIFFFLYLLARSLFRSVMGSFRSTGVPRTAPTQPPPVQAGGELKKDPVCGTYVSATASLTRMVNGKTFHFCSPECRDRYQAG
jgi:YHS domain-containing protein